MLEQFISALCSIIETLSNCLTLQYFEDTQEVWIINTKTQNKLYMGNVYQIIERAKHQQIINETTL